MNPTQLTKNFLALFLSNVLGQVFVLWAFVYIAGALGPEGFGKFSFAQVVALFFLYLADFGLQTVGTRAIAQRPEEASKWIWEISVLRVVLAIGSFGLLVLCTLIVSRIGDVQQLVLVFGIALFPSAILLEWLFQGMEQMWYVAIARVLKGAIFAFLVLMFVRTSHDLPYAAGFYVTGIGVAAGFLVMASQRKFRYLSGDITFSSLKDLFLRAIPLAVGSFVTQVNYNFGTLSLGLLVSDEAVGLFSAAFKIILFLWAFAAIAASNAILPAIARAYSLSTALYTDSLRKLFRLFVMVGIPLGVGGTILAPHIMGLLYSAEYQKAVVVLQLSIWMVVIILYRIVFENALVASKNHQHYLKGYLLAGGVTVAGNLLLVPILGLVAPSLVGILSEFVLLSYFVASCKYMRLSFIVRSTIRPLLAGFLMGVALWLLPLNLFLLLLIGIVVYFILLLVLRCITIQEVSAYVHALLG